MNQLIFLNTPIVKKNKNNKELLQKFVLFFAATFIWYLLIPYGYELVRILLMVAGLLVLFHGLLIGKISVPPKLLLLYFSITSLSIFWSINPQLTAIRIFQLSIFFIFSLFITFIFENKKGERLFLWYFIVSGISALFNILYLLFKHGSLRGTELHSIANDIGSSCELALPFFFYAAICKKGTWRFWFYAVTIPLLLLGIFLSGSRGAIISILLGSILFILAQLFLKKINIIVFISKRKIIILIITFFSIVVSPYLFKSYIPDDYLEKIYYRLQLISLDTSTRSAYLDRHDERIVALEDAKSAIIDHPILGIGYGGFQEISRNDIFLPHNWFLSAWVASGIGGVLCICILFFVSLRRGWRNVKISKNEQALQLAFFIALCMVWFHGLFRPVDFNPSFYILVIWSLFLRRFPSTVNHG